MKAVNILKLGAIMVVSATMLAGCTKPDSDDNPPASPKAETDNDASVTMDAATQERIGLGMQTPAPAEWQPEIHATGRAINPLNFMAAVSDYESVRTQAAASRLELDRTQKLAAESNASARMLEEARTAAVKDKLALDAARAKFTADWGAKLAAETNLMAMATKLESEKFSLVRLLLPVGTMPNPMPKTAVVYVFNDETNRLAGKFLGNLNIDPTTQVQTLLYSVKARLPADVAVEAALKTEGESVNGVVVPAAAVLRHEGKGWVYVQTRTNAFVRTEIPLDRLMDGGWFVSGNISITNRIVVTGAGAMLSAELSSGEFTTGERD